MQRQLADMTAHIQQLRQQEQALQLQRAPPSGQAPLPQQQLLPRQPHVAAGPSGAWESLFGPSPPSFPCEWYRFLPLQ